MKHTPGPWSVEDDERLTSVVIEYGEICDIVQDDRPEKENLANAHLIAAAPDLLEACREAVIQIEYLHEKFGPTGSGEAVLSRARAAITKAEGK